MTEYLQFPQHKDFYEFVDQTYCRFGRPTIDQTSIRLPSRHLWVAKGFPGHQEEKLYKQALITFENVTSSKRMIREYAPKHPPDNLKEAYTIDDGPFVPTDKETFNFYIGAFLYDPWGWVEWAIVAASVRIEEDK